MTKTSVMNELKARSLLQSRKIGDKIHFESWDQHSFWELQSHKILVFKLRYKSSNYHFSVSGIDPQIYGLHRHNLQWFLTLYNSIKKRILWQVQWYESSNSRSALSTLELLQLSYQEKLKNLGLSIAYVINVLSKAPIPGE